VITQARPQRDEVRVLYVVDILTNHLPEMVGYYPGIEHAWDAQRNPAEVSVAKTAAFLRAQGLQVRRHPWSWATQSLKLSETLQNGMPI
jgi:hypothetical protein